MLYPAELQAPPVDQTRHISIAFLRLSRELVLG